jgi:acyl-CoA reductase-like NAD-dependent aldehyde dehydrogenase
VNTAQQTVPIREGWIGRPSARPTLDPDPVANARRLANKAAAMFPKWSALGPSEIRRRLYAAADLLERRFDALHAVMSEEVGATLAWSRFNVETAAAMLREAAALTTQISGTVIPSNRHGVMSMGMRQPVGVVLGIAPWNAPVVLAVRAIATPLACGNTVVLKASEICPKTHTMVVDLLREAGIEADAIQVVTNEPAAASEVVEALIAHPTVRRVNFTGSTRVGRVVAVTAAKYLKPVLLELGGKAPLIVLDDADLDEAANAALFGGFANQGQICMSTERVVVDESVADAFAAKLAAAAQRLTAGPPGSGSTLGPVVGADAGQRIESMVHDAVSKGARLLAGGRSHGTLIDATVLDLVTPNMRIYAEECFGPVISIVRVHGDEEAVRVANDTDYGLSSSVFSRDTSRALAVARRLETGICHINGATVDDEPQAPFGGMKASGHGRFGGTAAIDEFTELRWITISTAKRKYDL